MYVVLDRIEKLIQMKLLKCHAVDLTERYVEPYFHAYLALIMLDCQGWQVCQSPLICEITYLSVKVEYLMLSLVFRFPCWMLQSYSLIAVTIDLTVVDAQAVEQASINGHLDPTT